MPTPPLSEETARQAVASLQAAIDAGFPYPGQVGKVSAVSEAARRAGIAKATLASRIEFARDRFGLTPQPPKAAAKPRISVRAATSAPLTEPGRIYEILAIGDHHDKPGRDKTRAKWIGRHAAETAPDFIVSIGDWASLDSLSTHEVPGSQNDAERPAFHEELESLDESLSLFHRDIDLGSIPVFHTHGNHEHRAWRAAGRQPKLNGDMPTRLDQVFARYRWQVQPFGEFLTLGGVDFVHCPLNVMGREMGGEHVERTVANKAMRSIVFGHTHKRNVHNAVKVGQSRRITAINLGTSMPYGMVEKYTGVAMSGWSYGCYTLRVQDGQILSEKFYDMIELSEKYGD